MATRIFNNEKESNINKKFIGIDLPFTKSNGSDGYFKSTTTTIEAVKNNIKNLLNTRRGERVFQPSFGIGLENYIFDQIDERLELIIKDEIISTCKIWLPFITIMNLSIETYDNSLEKNKLNIKLSFYINNNPNMHESLEVLIG